MSDLDSSTGSIDNEFGVPIMRPPEVKKVWYPITQFDYNEYIVAHIVVMTV